jgi:hypothetical protein
MRCEHDVDNQQRKQGSAPWRPPNRRNDQPRDPYGHPGQTKFAAEKLAHIVSTGDEVGKKLRNAPWRACAEVFAKERAWRVARVKDAVERDLRLTPDGIDG